MQQGQEQNLCYKVSENVWKIGVRPTGSENANQSSEQGQVGAGLPKKMPKRLGSRRIRNQKNKAGSKSMGSLRKRRKEAQSKSTDTDSCKSERSAVSEKSISETMSESVPGGPFRSDQQQRPSSTKNRMQRQGRNKRTQMKDLGQHEEKSSKERSISETTSVSVPGGPFRSNPPQPRNRRENVKPMRRKPRYTRAQLLAMLAELEKSESRSSGELQQDRERSGSDRRRRSRQRSKKPTKKGRTQGRRSRRSTVYD